MSYQYKGMGIVNVLWSGLSVLIIVSTGVIFFEETITWLDKIGIALILMGIGCVVSEGAH
jgi:multidrug transporter EmrE-like cation transporter